MAGKCEFRLAEPDDGPSVLDVYAPFITDTFVTFECEVPSVSEFRHRMTEIQKKYPWIVWETDGNIAGYAYASSFNARAAYDWSVDYSIYIRAPYQGRGIGKILYFILSGLLQLQGFCNAYAAITMPNEKSERLHQGIGFKPVGVFHDVGYKLGSWHDVKWFELQLQEYPRSPRKPLTIDELRQGPAFDAVFKTAVEMLLKKSHSFCIPDPSPAPRLP